MESKNKTTTGNEIILLSYIQLNDKFTHELCNELELAFPNQCIMAVEPPFEILLRRRWHIYTRWN